MSGQRRRSKAWRRKLSEDEDEANKTWSFVNLLVLHDAQPVWLHDCKERKHPIIRLRRLERPADGISERREGGCFWPMIGSQDSVRW